MESFSALLEQIRALADPLSAEERLTLIRAIATAEQETENGNQSSAERSRQLAAEQTAWYARPSQERHQHPGEFVAVYNGQIVDHDTDQRVLYLRVRARFGRSPVLIVHNDWEEPPVYTIHSPRLEQS